LGVKYEKKKGRLTMKRKIVNICKLRKEKNNGKYLKESF
jgi:hypothetical protein